MKLHHIITALSLLSSSFVCMGMNYTPDKFYPNNPIICSPIHALDINMDEAAWLAAKIQLDASWKKVHGYDFPETMDSSLQALCKKLDEAAWLAVDIEYNNNLIANKPSKVLSLKSSR